MSFIIRLVLSGFLILPFLNNSYAGIYEDIIQKSYIAYYGRAADPAGLAYWEERIEEAGGNINSIIDDFGNSEEYNQRFSGLDNKELLSNIYLSLLNRLPEEAGLTFYENLLDSNQSTLAKISFDVTSGAISEDKITVNNKLDVAKYYTNTVTNTGEEYNQYLIGPVLNSTTSNYETVITARGNINNPSNKHYDLSGEWNFTSIGGFHIHEDGGCSLNPYHYEDSFFKLKKNYDYYVSNNFLVFQVSGNNVFSSVTGFIPHHNNYGITTNYNGLITSNSETIIIDGKIEVHCPNSLPLSIPAKYIKINKSCPNSPPINNYRFRRYGGEQYLNRSVIDTFDEILGIGGFELRQSAGEIIFHCEFDTYVENITPSEKNPQLECVYDNSGLLVDENHPYSACKGTNNYFVDSHNHKYKDPGGICKSGKNALIQSRVLAHPKWKDLIDITEWWYEDDCNW